MTQTKDGGPAFPSVENHPNFDVPAHYHGMSLRDWFAGQALASGTLKYSGLTDRELAERFGNRTNITAEEILACNAYRTADAMLAAREVKP